MGQTDRQIGVNYVEAGFIVPGRGPMTINLFAELIRGELTDYANLLSLALEKDDMVKAPGVFGPPCSKHETISDGGAVFETTIRVSGDDLAMFDVFEAWRAGTSPSVAIAEPGSVATCVE
jgi:hypothetical protein